jgi:site-specific DNA-methyltransferase (adenine-specific)
VKTKIRRAFAQSAEGYSADRVVADSRLNDSFVEHCRRAGLELPVAQLNLALLNARKGRLLTGLPRAKRTHFADEAQYRYACEIAARFLEQKHATSLDHILAEPITAAEFDAIAADISPGFESLHYRWAALNLRKASRLKPELLARVVRPAAVQLGRLTEVAIDGIPTSQGVYLMYAPHQALYVGEAEQLRRRIAKHLDHSDNKELARWFWEQGITDVHLEVYSLPDGTSTQVRRALELELIRSRRPMFNVRR